MNNDFHSMDVADLIAGNARLRVSEAHGVEMVYRLEARLAALTADLARMADELISRDAGLTRAREDAGKFETDLARAQENALLHASRNVALEADLARVTGERNRLAHGLHLLRSKYLSQREANADIMRLDDLLSDIAACIPLASRQREPLSECPTCGAVIDAYDVHECGPIAARPAPVNGEKE